MVNEIVELFKKVALMKYNILVPSPIQHYIISEMLKF